MCYGYLDDFETVLNYDTYLIKHETTDWNTRTVAYLEVVF